MRYRFEDFELDTDRRELTRRSDPVAVGPQVFDLLLFLIENRDRVVSRDALLETVWDGRIVSESTLASHISAVRKAIGDTGEEQRLLRTLARKGFRFVAEVTLPPSADHRTAGELAAAPEEPRPALTLPEKPSIAVLPFLSLSGDPEQDYFADGIVEDIIAALSRIGWLFVVARNSTFAYKGTAVDVRQVGRELGVRYVLGGSVRRAANRVRIAGQLADATTARQLWAERYEGALDDIFELQDLVTESVVGAISPQLERAEMARAERKPTANLDAYDYFLRGMARYHAGGRQGLDQAFSCYQKAIELDPNFSSAYAMAAWCIFSRSINGWLANPTEEMAEGARLARCAVELGKTDAVALSRGGHALAHFERDLDLGIDFLDSALALNPNSAATWLMGGFLRLYRGEPDEAVTWIERAMRLSPLDSEMFRMRTGLALAHLIAGRFDIASFWAARSFRDAPHHVLPGAVAAASYAHAGRLNEARRAMQQVLEFNPALHLDGFTWLPFRRPEDRATFEEGLRRAGLDR
jgi:TolB-like protein